MARRLAKNVVLRNPDTGAPTTLLAGDDVPSWASKLVTNPKALAAEGDGDEPEFPEGDPADSWKVPQLKAYAAANGVDLGEATKKADILAVLNGAPAGDDEGDAGENGQGQES